MKQSEKLMQLLELMQANPELPVIPCVDGDVVGGDEYYCWLGSWGESAVQEFIICKLKECKRKYDTPFNRETQEVYSNVEEETADVFIMLVQLFAIFNPHELVNITKIVWDKLDRLKDNLDKEAAKQEASDAGKK